MRLTHLGEAMSKWRNRRDMIGQLGAMVPLDSVCDEVIADLVKIEQAQSDETLTLREAAQESGYSTDHLRRLIRDGTVPNAGRKHAPLVHCSDLPRKPGHLRSDVPGINNATPSREQIVRAVVNSDAGENDGQDT